MGSAADPALCDLFTAQEMLTDAARRVLPDREADWIASSVLRLYAIAEEGDPMRPAMQPLVTTVNKAMRTFHITEQRERRENERNLQKRRQESSSEDDNSSEGDGGGSSGAKASNASDSGSKKPGTGRARKNPKKK